MPDVIEAIKNRVSSPKLTSPAPNKQEIEVMLQCAVQAPDHGRLRPWQFIVVQGEGLERLGRLFVEAKQAEASLDERQREKLLNMPLRAPMIIIAIAKTQSNAKVPRHEQLLSVGVAVQNIQLAARSLGYGAMWRTGELAEHSGVKAALGLDPDDVIIAYLYLGTPAGPDKPRAPNPIDDCVSYWQ